ncbi:methionine synthase [Millisia brevis]|uniref:methionine synthase n=1 Tax=Millisia brevis TaxID=264148 RepID=UPI0008361EC0|nr:methionine synthase [Millisia brevis]
MTEAPILDGPPTASGVGSWPGTDPLAAAEVILGELDRLPYLPELPARGIGADMIGRCAAVLVDIEFDTSTTGYRVASRPGPVGRRARDLLSRDLDAFEEALEKAGGIGGRERPTLKVQWAGPWTLAATLELSGGHRVLTDRGAARDIAASLAEGIAEHSARLEKRFGVSVVVQLDEPELPSVLAGSLGAVSILDSVAAVREPRVQDVLETVIARIGRPVVLHCCARRDSTPDSRVGGVPFALLGRTGAAGIGFDATGLTTEDLDGVAEVVDGGTRLFLGLVPSTAPARPADWKTVVRPALDLVDRIGFSRTLLGTAVDVTPTCGLAGATTAWARRATDLSVEVARALAEEPETLGR